MTALLTPARPVPSRLLDRPAFLTRVESPIGRIQLTSDGTALTSLSIETAGHLSFDGLPERSTEVLKVAGKQLREYFSRKRTEFTVPVALDGTPFQRAVWAELASLPFGSVTSYGAIGAATGRLTAGRAVGGAIGANPIPIIVPCHRVLATNRRITGYSAGNGIPTKAWLLDFEGIAHV